MVRISPARANQPSFLKCSIRSINSTTPQPKHLISGKFNPELWERIHPDDIKYAAKEATRIYLSRWNRPPSSTTELAGLCQLDGVSFPRLTGNLRHSCLSISALRLRTPMVLCSDHAERAASGQEHAPPGAEQLAQNGDQQMPKPTQPQEQPIIDAEDVKKYLGKWGEYEAKLANR